MTYKCKNCEYLWDWDVAIPYACPNCKSLTNFEKCDERPGHSRGRQATPDNYICPHCKKDTIKLYARGVCRSCFHILLDLEARTKPPITNAPKKEITKTFRKDDWWCADCGTRLSADEPECPICYPPPTEPPTEPLKIQEFPDGSIPFEDVINPDQPGDSETIHDKEKKFKGLSKEWLEDIIVTIGGHELRIDIDEPDGMETFLVRIHLIQRALGIHVEDCSVFNTKHGFHIKIITATPLSPFEILLIQSMCGDDFKHTLAGYNQLRQCVPPRFWNRLFSVKFYLNRLGVPYKASEESSNTELTVKLYTFLTQAVTQ